MRYGVVRFAIGIIVTMMLGGLGCSVAVYEYASSPVSKTIETQSFTASFAPARESAPYFSSFLLEIENKSDDSIEIDWNKTLYIHDEKNRGGFVFKGIEPSQVREKRIPNEVIFPRTRFSRQLFPIAKIAMAERKDYSAGKDKPGLYGGKLPAGENSIVLSVQVQEKLIRKKISVVIMEQVK
jgi:hypothetical protein